MQNTVEVQLTYQNLPFQVRHIVEVFPVVKHLDI